LAALRGHYLFADFCVGDIWEVDVSEISTPGSIGAFSVLCESGRSGLGFLSTFGEDAQGVVYAATVSGTLFRIPEPPLAILQLTALGLLAV